MTMRVLAFVGLCVMSLLAQAAPIKPQQASPRTNKMSRLMYCRDGPSAVVWYSQTMRGHVIVQGMMMDGQPVTGKTLTAINEKLQKRLTRDIVFINPLCVDKDISVTFITYRLSPTLEAHGKTIRVSRTKLSSEVVTESPTEEKLFFLGKIWNAQETIVLRRPSALLSDFYGPL